MLFRSDFPRETAGLAEAANGGKRVDGLARSGEENVDEFSAPRQPVNLKIGIDRGHRVQATPFAQGHERGVGPASMLCSAEQL